MSIAQFIVTWPEPEPGAFVETQDYLFHCTRTALKIVI